VKTIDVSSQDEFDEAVGRGDKPSVRKGRLVARGSASVEAWDSASVVAWDSASVEAGPCVVIRVRSGRATISGGVCVKPPATAREWVERAGLKVEDGIVTLYKAVTENYASSRGFLYTPGTVPEASYWDAGPECGSGLHFVSHPKQALSFHPGPKFVACPVRVDEIVVHQWGHSPWKVKAPRCAGPVWECDESGNAMEAFDE
jgi:hypothetical protein